MQNLDVVNNFIKDSRKIFGNKIQFFDTLTLIDGVSNKGYAQTENKNTVEHLPSTSV